MLALHNINRFHWHLSEDQGWRIEIKSRPELTEIGSKRAETVIGHNSGKYDGKPYGGFFTQEEAKEIVAYAAERHITVIPKLICRDTCRLLWLHILTWAVLVVRTKYGKSGGIRRCALRRK